MGFLQPLMGFLQPSGLSLITELSLWELSLSIIVLLYSHIFAVSFIIWPYDDS